MEIKITESFLEDLVDACNCVEPWKEKKNYLKRVSDIKSLKFDKEYIIVNGIKVWWETFIKYHLLQ